MARVIQADVVFLLWKVALSHMQKNDLGILENTLEISAGEQTYQSVVLKPLEGENHTLGMVKTKQETKKKKDDDPAVICCFI